MANEGKFPKNDGDIYYAKDANSSYYQAALSTTAAYDAVTVTSSATVIVTENNARKKILIRNIGADTIYIGEAGVTVTTGIPLDSNVCIVLNTSDAISGIVSSTSSEIRYIEVL